MSCIYQKQSRSEKLSQYLGPRELKTNKQTKKSMYKQEKKKKSIGLVQTNEIIILNSPLLSVWQNPAMGIYSFKFKEPKV